RLRDRCAPFFTSRVATPGCLQRVAGTDLDGDLINRRPWRYVKLRVIREPPHGCQEFGVRPCFCESLSARPFRHVDEAKLGILDQRFVHAGADEPWLAGHDPCIILPTPQELIRLVKRYGERVYQCNRFIPCGFAERDLIAHVVFSFLWDGLQLRAEATKAPENERKRNDPRRRRRIHYDLDHGFLKIAPTRAPCCQRYD